MFILKPLSPWYDNPPYHIYYHFTLYIHTHIHSYQIWLISIKERRFGGRSESHFPIEILAQPGKIFEIRELDVIAKRVFFLKVLNLQINS